MISNGTGWSFMVARRSELRAVPRVVVSLIGAAIWQWRSPGLGVELTMAVAPVAPLGFPGETAALIAVLSIWRTCFALGPFEWVLRRITYAWHRV